MGKNQNQALGRQGEEMACQHLLSQGYKVVDRNWRCARGELDIVCVDPQSTLVFVEVKTRSTPMFGGSAYAISPEKYARLRRLIGLWLAQAKQSGLFQTHSLRLDLVLIDVIAGQPAKLLHMKGV